MADTSIRKIVIAGASGFVGRSLVERLRTQYEIIALSRSPAKIDPASEGKNEVEWRQCDLFSMLEAEQGVQGADAGVYLVHSMIPSAHLSQGSFEDFDLIVADNFRRASEKFGLKHIVYLGGLLPEKYERADLSRHLRSRCEVEEVFKDRKIPVTVLRAAMVLGGSGSSFQIMARLVERLPFMIGPSWTKSLSQPVALKDVIIAIEYCLQHTESCRGVFDLGGPTVLSYQEMMRKTAKRLGRTLFILGVPAVSMWLSRLWVTLITGAPRDLIVPLIESLRHDMRVREHCVLKIPGHQFATFDEALDLALQDYDSTKNPRAFSKARVRDTEVRSVQRLVLPETWDATHVARAYMAWLPKLTPWFITVELLKDRAYVSMRWPHVNILILQYSAERSSPDRQLFYIKGGLLSRSSPKGRMEFREVLGGKYVIAAIHNFKPSIPWYIYRCTQALVHLWTMIKFGQYLKYKNDTGHTPAAVK